VLGKRGVNEGNEEQLEEFGKAWRVFFEQRWLELHREKKWTQPKSVSFSGGVLKKPGVVEALKKHCVEESLTGVSSIVFVEEPDVAGLLGAAVLARKGKKLP
jgi:activator of 2-hydroxyglutaryl-CoA dehydratase